MFVTVIAVLAATTCLPQIDY